MTLVSNRTVPLLLIFVRNPLLGKVKHRLAMDIGKERALDIYMRLLAHTEAVAASLSIRKWVYYSSHIPKSDGFDRVDFGRRLQAQGDGTKPCGLGERMQAAFAEAFGAGYRPVLIIGSDCPGILPMHIDSALQALHRCAYVLGPAQDGGYYLLGMQAHSPALFSDISWGGPEVAKETLDRIPDGSYYLLPTLQDVDRGKDIHIMKDMGL